MITLIKNNITGTTHLQLGKYDTHCGLRLELDDESFNKLYTVKKESTTYEDFKKRTDICDRCKRTLNGTKNKRYREMIFIE